MRGNPIEPIAELPAERIALVQIADAPAIQMDPLSLSRRYRCYPGQGDYPPIDFLHTVTRAGYCGPVSLEIFDDQFRGASASMIAVDGPRALRTSGEQLAQRLAERGAPPLADLAPLPKAPAVEAVEFLEFTVTASESAALAALIEGLDVPRVARHRSKDVDLYRVGAVNFVLNRERESFAHSFNLLRGAGVCALALRVDNVEQALERARVMECPAYFGRIGSGEALIPAVGDVEASLVYFIDKSNASHWERDFVVEGSDDAESPLHKIDHLSNVVRRSEFLSWALFYKTVPGFRSERQVDFADPHGAFFSRSLLSPNNEGRIALNDSDGGETVATRFLDAFGGAGFQQIALLADDIFSTVEAAKARGVAFLDIPDNYFDDLAARFDIAPELLACMRPLGVLYDKSQDGEFFHISTRAFRDRFFFEIVQRNNYDLFGAANTRSDSPRRRARDEEAALRLDFE